MILFLLTLVALYGFITYKILTYTLGVIHGIKYSTPETRNIHVAEAIVMSLFWPAFFYVLVLFLRRARDL